LNITKKGENCPLEFLGTDKKGPHFVENIVRWV
jgi:hypothetical protein